MSRDKRFDDYMDGMTNALAIVLEAKQDGKDPATAIADEIRWRKHCDKILIPNITQKEIEAETAKLKKYAVKAIEAVALATLWEEHNFRTPALKRFRKTYHTYANALINNSIFWSDILTALEVETGITFDYDGIFRFKEEVKS